MKIRLTIQPTEATLETAQVLGGQDSRVLDASSAQLAGIRAYADQIKAGATSGVDARIALTDADVIAVVDAAVGLENMSPAQKAGLLAYIAAIIAEEDTSSVETAITNL